MELLPHQRELIKQLAKDIERDMGRTVLVVGAGTALRLDLETLRSEGAGCITIVVGEDAPVPSAWARKCAQELADDRFHALVMASLEEHAAVARLDRLIPSHGHMPIRGPTRERAQWKRETSGRRP